MPRVKHGHAGLMRLRVRLHGREHAEIVRPLCQMRQQLAHPLPALAVLLEFPRAAEQLAARLAVLSGERFAVVFLKLGFVIKRVEVRDAALHEEQDHALRLRRKMRFACRGARRQAGEGQVAETAQRATEHVAAGEDG